MKAGARKIYVVLHNIRSVHNVASIFRTADCLGVTHAILVGYTPSPVDRFGRMRKDFAKVSLGAERAILWQQVDLFSEAEKILKKEQVQIIAVEQSPDATLYTTVVPARMVAFVVGNEVEGLPKDVLLCADVVAEIPMCGEKESLNVSVATGIAIAGILNNGLRQ